MVQWLLSKNTCVQNKLNLWHSLGCVCLSIQAFWWIFFGQQDHMCALQWVHEYRALRKPIDQTQVPPSQLLSSFHISVSRQGRGSRVFSQVSCKDDFVKQQNESVCSTQQAYCSSLYQGKTPEEQECEQGWGYPILRQYTDIQQEAYLQESHPVPWDVGDRNWKVPAAILT